MKGYLQVSGVPGNSFDRGYLRWIELVKFDVKLSGDRRPAGASTAWQEPIHVYAWSIHGPYSQHLETVWKSGKEFVSAVLEIVKQLNNRPVVTKRIRMKNVHVMLYHQNNDPGFIKPVSHYILVPKTYIHEVGSALIEHEQLHATV